MIKKIISVTSHLLTPLPLSQTVTLSRTPIERDVLYGRPLNRNSEIWVTAFPRPPSFQNKLTPLLTPTGMPRDQSPKMGSRSLWCNVQKLLSEAHSSAQPQ